MLPFATDMELELLVPSDKAVEIDDVYVAAGSEL
jgi:hypothetical protein